MTLVDYFLLFVQSVAAIDEVVLVSTIHCIGHAKHYDVVFTYGLRLRYCQICDSVRYRHGHRQRQAFLNDTYARLGIGSLAYRAITSRTVC